MTMMIDETVEDAVENVHHYVGNNPLTFVDPTGLQGIPYYQGSGHHYSETYTDDQINAFVIDGVPLPKVQPDPIVVPIFRGYEDPRYQQHDKLIHDIVAAFNANKKGYAGCTDQQASKIPDLDAAVIKSWMIQETGGNGATSKAAWQVDPAQVNVPGDWNTYKPSLGLTQPTRRNEGNIETNLKAAVAYLVRKGYGVTGRPAVQNPNGVFDGWQTALERYNGRTVITTNGQPYRVNYASQILGRAGNPTVFYPIDLPQPR